MMASRPSATEAEAKVQERGLARADSGDSTESTFAATLSARSLMLESEEMSGDEKPMPAELCSEDRKEQGEAAAVAASASAEPGRGSAAEGSEATASSSSSSSASLAWAVRSAEQMEWVRSTVKITRRRPDLASIQEEGLTLGRRTFQARRQHGFACLLCHGQEGCMGNGCPGTVVATRTLPSASFDLRRAMANLGAMLKSPRMLALLLSLLLTALVGRRRWVRRL